MTDDLLELTVEIVSAYVSKNQVPASGLPNLVRDVNAALAILSTPAEFEEPARAPAVNPKRSVHPDYIVCLEDGLKFKSLKRHLKTSHGLTPAQYRERWGLAADYPIVAPEYSAARSGLAKTMGLGRKPGTKVKKAGKQKANA